MYTDIPLSLYIHIPWCVKKCPYCDFNSHVHKFGHHHISDMESEYVKALLMDLQQDIQTYQIDRSVSTVFIGGGTPSLFSDKAIDRLLCGINHLVPLDSNVEITLEANPGSTETQFLQGYQHAGVNRLSLGVQSFQDHCLQKLGRIHNSQDALRTIDTIQNIDFDSWNIDLMFGLPGQSISDTHDDINRLLSICPPHVSAYHLTIEHNTAFATNTPTLPKDEDMDLIHDLYLEALQSHHYLHYETSAHAINNQHLCRHNLNYWQFGDYLGIGAGAHGKITLDSRPNKEKKIIRTEKTLSPQMYLNAVNNKNFTRKKHVIKTEDLPLEYAMNALRLKEGFTQQHFEEKTGLSMAILDPFLHSMTLKNWISQTQDRVVPTEQGRLFLNDMLYELLQVKHA